MHIRAQNKGEGLGEFKVVNYANLRCLHQAMQMTLNADIKSYNGNKKGTFVLGSFSST